ncbi:MAG: beta-ketoacyl-ACP reductase [Alphaproteobacteria bacterium]|jgi:3-oxoacyl-[acyl-carrier protein] reductase|nr:beta-ketoacyl-ACP reductase [Alphaproteobacteria bacterium]MDF3033113.1 beta-ketoacyl-ACP reductase [Alphaproteobacteria bacterium]
MFQLTDQTALVTGASGGIGSAIARAFHAQGATIALSGTREETLHSLAAELKATGAKNQVYVVPCNLMDSQAVEDLFPKAEELMGKVDILVNNAGITRDGLSMRLKDEDWAQVLDVNLTSSFRLCRAAVKAMMKRRTGRIINISSIVGVTGNTGQANYAAAKAGIIGLSKSLAQEVASRGITVNCIAPGFITSAMTDELPASVKEKILLSVPQGRMGAPEEIAAGAVYLASPEAGYMTGQTLHINGGMFMG